MYVFKKYQVVYALYLYLHIYIYIYIYIVLRSCEWTMDQAI